jgi:hypothetical protein
MKMLSFENNRSVLEIYIEVDRLHLSVYDKSGEKEIVQYRMSKADTRILFEELMEVESLGGQEFIRYLRDYADSLEAEYEHK